MMNGIVTGLQARLEVLLILDNDSMVGVECVIDTGFEGFLTLPPDMVQNYGLAYLGPIDASLADNSSIVTHVYEGVILWNGMERSIPVLAMGNFPLIGTALLKGSHLSIDFCDEGIVTVDEIR
jgi:clan AA aspartic protease